MIPIPESSNVAGLEDSRYNFLFLRRATSAMTTTKMLRQLFDRLEILIAAIPWATPCGIRSQVSSAEVVDELITETVRTVPGPAAAHSGAVVDIFLSMLLVVFGQVALAKETFAFASGHLA